VDELLSSSLAFLCPASHTSRVRNSHKNVRKREALAMKIAIDHRVLPIQPLVTLTTPVAKRAVAPINVPETRSHQSCFIDFSFTDVE
jgi:hypothetical protein